MIEPANRDPIFGVAVNMIAIEVVLTREAVLAIRGIHRIRVADDIEIAPDAGMFDPHQLRDMIELVEHMLLRHGLVDLDHETDQRNSHHAAGLGQFHDHLVRLAARISRHERTACRVREDRRFARRRDSVERRAIATVRKVDGHSDRIHPLDDLRAERGKAGVGVGEKT